MRNPDVAIIIPVFNEEKVIAETVHELMPLAGKIICVNDGSVDDTRRELEKTGAQVLNHLTNIGQGGALETGVKFALRDRSTKYFITYDADGQHRADDAERLIDEMRTGGCDIILGSRFLGENSVPLSKRIILRLAIWFTKLSTGLNLTDTHNGLRIFNRSFAEKFNLQNFGMSHASEILDIIKKNDFKYREIPVSVYYTEYSRSKGQPIINGVNIFFDILLNKKD